MTTQPVNALCYPHPDCQDKQQCARYMPVGIPGLCPVSMNAAPYLEAGKPCAWFVAAVKEAA